MLEDDIVEQTLTMDTDDTKTMDIDENEQIYGPTSVPQTSITMPEHQQTHAVTYMDLHSAGTATDSDRSDLWMFVRDECQKVNARIDKLEGMLTKLLEQQNSSNIPVKPTWLPITTMAAMQQFQNTGEAYDQVVKYLEYVGGFNLRDAVKICFREAIDDKIIAHYSWRGKDPNKLSLRDTRIARAIHDAVVANKNYQQPTKKEIEAKMMVALKAAKERVRNQTRRQTAVYVLAPNSENFWDESEGEVKIETG